MFSKCFCWQSDDQRSSMDGSSLDARTLDVITSEEANESIPLDDIGSLRARRASEELPESKFTQEKEAEGSSESEITLKQDRCEKKELDLSLTTTDEELSKSSSRQSSRKGKGKRGKKARVKEEENEEESAMSIEDILKIISHESVIITRCSDDDESKPVEIKSDIDVIFSEDTSSRKEEKGYGEKDHNMKTMVSKSILPVAETSKHSLTSTESEEILVQEKLKEKNISLEMNTLKGMNDVSECGETEFETSKSLEEQKAGQICEEKTTLLKDREKHAYMGTESEEKINTEHEELVLPNTVLKQTSLNNLEQEMNELETSNVGGERKVENEFKMNNDGDTGAQMRGCCQASNENMTGKESQEGQQDLACSGTQNRRGWYWKNLKTFLTVRKSVTLPDNYDRTTPATHSLFRDLRRSYSSQELAVEAEPLPLETELYGFPKGFSKRTTYFGHGYDVSTSRVQNQFFKKKMDKAFLDASYKTRCLKDRMKSKSEINISKQSEMFESRESSNASCSNHKGRSVTTGGTSNANDTMKSQAQEENDPPKRATVPEIRDLRHTGAIPKTRPVLENCGATLAADSSGDDVISIKKDNNLKVRNGRSSNISASDWKQRNRRARILETDHSSYGQPWSLLEQHTLEVPNGTESSGKGDDV